MNMVLQHLCKMDKQGRKIGIALSGGGYRASAYHVGTLRALHKLGVLDKVDVISSVSGGSITSAYYALNKGKGYELFEKSFVNKLQKGVMNDVWLLLALVMMSIIILSGIIGGLVYFVKHQVWLSIFICIVCFISAFVYLLLRWYNYMPISYLISRKYDSLFFKNKTLRDFPETPLLTLNATNIATNLPFNFSRGYMGEYIYCVNRKSIFKADSFPISKAVMASSCVPYGFTPIKINEKYLLHKYEECDKNPEPPLLVDGGIFDNQGAHKLSEKKSRFHADLIIVSDAGNGEIKAAHTNNFLITLYKTSEMMMNRIKNLQFIHNIYEGHESHSHYAYIPLRWDCSDWLISGFIRNLRENNVHPDVWEYHGISESEVENLIAQPTAELSWSIENKIKSSIGWDRLEKLTPSKESELKARKTGTNLTALSKEKINALIAHSEWMTEAQVRLYLPFLIND